MKHERILALDGPLNFRDIGGYQNGIKFTVQIHLVLCPMKISKS